MIPRQREERQTRDLTSHEAQLGFLGGAALQPKTVQPHFLRNNE